MKRIGVDLAAPAVNDRCKQIGVKETYRFALRNEMIYKKPPTLHKIFILLNKVDFSDSVIPSELPLPYAGGTYCEAP